MVGVGIGILTMRFAAGVFSYAVQREPILKQAAYVLVLSIGIELILEEVWKVEISDIVRFLISMAIILGALAGILCERSGVINIGIEGIMLMAAQAAVMVGTLTHSLFAGLLAALVLDAIYGRTP